MATQNNPPIIIRDVGSKGLIMQDVVDESLTPSGSLAWAINFHFDKIGAATVRPGITLLGSQILDNNSIIGLSQFLDTGTGTNDALVAVAGSSAYALMSGSWSVKRTGLSTGSKARFTNFIDVIFMVNGTEAMNTWDGGAGNFGTAHATSAPTATYIENFRSRVWAARTSSNPSRVTYSSVASAGTVAWTGSDSSFIDVAPGDGEDITGIKKFVGALYVFKNTNIYRIFSINESEPDTRISIGTYSQESINVAKDGMYWHHPSGIYRMRRGETQPVEISRPIYDIIKNVTRANYSEVASWSDDDHVYFHLGNISVYGIAITNCAIRWTMSTESWTIYSYSVPLIIGTQYDTSSSISRVVGDNDGNVYTVDSGVTDNGSDIFYELETRWLNITGLRSETKSIQRMAAIHENLVGANIGWRNGNMHRQEIKPIKQLGNQETICNSMNVKGNRFKFSVRGVSNAGSGVFQGLEILEYLNEGVLDA